MKKDVTQNPAYARLYSYFAAQCEAVYALELPQEDRDRLIAEIKNDMSHNTKYALLKKGEFRPPYKPASSIRPATSLAKIGKREMIALEAIVENLGR